MRVLTTYKDYIKEAIAILKTESGHVRISSFSISDRDEDTRQFLNLTLAATTSILVGTMYRSCTVGCWFTS